MARTSFTILIDETRRELTNITGLKAESTVGTFKDEKGWHILVEMLEKKSIPDGLDILATYEAITSESGELLEFNRRKMRKRIDIDNGGEDN